MGSHEPSLRIFLEVERQQTSFPSGHPRLGRAARSIHTQQVCESLLAVSWFQRTDAR